MILAPMPAHVAGVTLTPPRTRYEVEVDDPDFRSASLERPHAARALEGATLSLRLTAADRAATFEAKPFLTPPVVPYLEMPAAAWRGLLVEQRMLSRPELVWTGAFPQGWDEGMPAPWAEALRGALMTLHRRWLAISEERWAEYSLRTLECAECRDERVAKLPPNLPAWQIRYRTDPTQRCLHGVPAMRALAALGRAHPELTFELLGWIEPAGARVPAEGPEPTRFALTGPLMSAVLAPWLIGEESRLAMPAAYRSYASSRYYYQRAWYGRAEKRPPTLSRSQENGVSLAAQAWGFTESPEDLVRGDASAAPPSLDRTASPPIEVSAALPGEPVRGKAKRARRAKK